MRVLLTGASGFVGSAVAAALKRADHEILPMSFSEMLVGGDSTYGQSADVCIHLAARVHVMNESSSNPLAEFRRSNVEGTLRLARMAAAAGVRRFVFMSSIKVNGETTERDRAFSASDKPAPRDPYGISKLEAEIALTEHARETGMELVIIRPPLVYGPGVKANFQAMMRLIYRGVPLPIATLDNLRSFIGIDNLVSLVETCIAHPAAANRVFLASDGEDISTPELATRLGIALGRRARLVSVPEILLNLGAKLVGKPHVVQRLSSSLRVDITMTRDVLGWTPPVTVDSGLKQTTESWIRSLP